MARFALFGDERRHDVLRSGGDCSLNGPLNRHFNYDVINASATMPLVVPVDRAQGFEQRLDEFMQKEQARQKHWTVKSSRLASQRVWHKGNSD